MKHLLSSNRRRLFSLLLGLSASLLGGGDSSLGASTPLPIAIYQSPLSVAIAAHPQVVIAFANSESMDGNLSGAIMTGSGSLGGSVSELQNTASPVNFVVPAGFSPPPAPSPGLTAGAVGSSQPYTVSLNGHLVDNSPSRMNLAKAGIYSILNSFMANTDFALMDYATGQLQESPTWVYYMSAGAGFTVVDTVPATARAVANPCYQVNLTGGDAVGNSCQSMSAMISGINAHPWLIIGSSSDDAAINDVLYDWYSPPPVCMVSGGPAPISPYPPNGDTLATYNAGQVTETYAASTERPGGCPNQTGPTNAGFVPYSAQVMYVERGFSYYTYSEYADTSNLLVGMTTVGSNLSASNVAAKIALFTPFLYPETNSSNTTEIKSSSTQAPTAGLLKGALSYYRNVNPSSSNGCSASRYVVLVTDGLPTMDLNKNAWPPLGSSAAAGYGVSATWNADGSLGTTNDQALTDTINELAALNAAGIKTYIIGLGAGVAGGGNSQAAPTLTAMAIAGGTNVYFPATDPATLTSDMQVILATIQAGTQSTATAAVNSTSIHVGAVIYQGQFSSSDAAQDWSGNVYAFPINAATGTVTTSPSAALWGAQSLLDAKSPASRVIATWDTVANAGTPFEWTTGTPSNGIASSTAMGRALSNSPYDASGADALSFLRGVQSLSYSNGGPFRARAHLLGDIVDSAPLYVAAASGNFNSSSYASFVASVAARTPVVYVGANDGMLHAFSAATGTELFAYIPRGVFGNLLNLTGRYYAGNHQFYVDGAPVAGDVNFNGTWHTLLAGGEGAGGNSIYAIDVTAPQSLTSESALAAAVLWDFTDSNMGLTYSRPVIINANVGPLVVFGNGINSPTEQPYFYAINAQTGAVVAKINLCALVASVCSTSVANGLSSVVAANLNGDLSSNATLIYAGDLQGNLWRIDISNVNPSLWTVTVLFQARDPSGAMQPITSAPAVTLNPNYPRYVGEMVFVGTGQLLGIGDLSTTQVQSMYGVYDNNSAPTTPILRTNMVQQTLSNLTINLTGGGTLAGRTDTMNTVNLLQKGGWYVDLLLVSGERIISDPQVDSGAVIVTSIEPTGNVCTGGDYSWLNLFNFATGGGFPSAPLTLSTQSVSGVSLGETYSSSPRVEINNSGSSSREILVTESGTGAAISTNGTVPIVGFNMYGRVLHRTAWTELR